MKNTILNLDGLEVKYLTSFDNVRIAYQVVGDGPVIVLANGLGGSVMAWKHIIDWFKDRFRFISWDYRGQYDSETPENWENLAMAHHCRDLELILEKEQVNSYILAGWSMGVQLIFEFYRHHGANIEGMLVVNGTYGSPFKTAFNHPLSRVILPKTIEVAQQLAPFIHYGINFVHDKWFLIPAIITLGLINKNIDRDIFNTFAREFAKMDMSVYFEIFKHLGKHDASDVLKSVEAPTLIIHGENDTMTPPNVTERMRREIKNCEIFSVPYGSHYSIIEFPEVVNYRLESFLRQFLP